MEQVEDLNKIQETEVRFDIVENKENHADNFNIDSQVVSRIFLEYYDRLIDEEMDEIAHLGGSTGLETLFKTNIHTGLDSTNEADFQLRKEEFGQNIMETHVMPSMWTFIKNSLEDNVLKILIILGIAQVIVGASPITEDSSKDWIEGASLLISIALVSIVSIITNYTKEKKFLELNAQGTVSQNARVIRNSEEISIPVTDILVGDIIKVSYGDIIPADGLIVKAINLIVDETVLGEHLEIQTKKTFEKCKKRIDGVKGQKQLPSPLACSGTFVKEGSGSILVMAVGKNTRKGQIILDILESSSGENMTPVQSELSHIMEHMAYFGMIFALLILILMFANLAANYGKTVGEQKVDKSLFLEIVDIIILTVALIVVSVPEGMPLACVLVLAVFMKKMLADNCLIKQMHGMETMAEVSYMLINKNGVMTSKDLVLTSVFNNLIVSKLEDFDFRASEYNKFLIESIILTLSADFDENNEVVNINRRDKPILEYLKQKNIDIKEYAIKYFSKEEKIKRLPYDKDKRRKYFLINHESFPTKYRLYIKTDNENLIDHSEFYIDADNKRQVIESHDFFRNEFESLERQGEIAKVIAFKDIDEDLFLTFEEQIKNISLNTERDLTIVGYIGLKDEFIDDLKENIELVKKQNINFILLTEDKKNTAIGIAKEIGLILEGEEGLAIRGNTFYDQIGGLGCESCGLVLARCCCPRSDKEKAIRGESKVALRVEKIRDMVVFEEIIKDVKIIYECKDNIKLAAVLGLKTLGETVAITGEGTSDAQTLLLADVGFSMNKNSTEIVKDSCDIIILDDSFNSIIQTIKWGRNLIANTKKFCQFQLTVNFSSTWLIFLGVVIGNETPLRPLQVLWINLYLNTLGSLGLVFEPFEDRLNHIQPLDRSEGIVDKKMWKHIMIQSVYIFLVSVAIYLAAPYYIPEHDTDRKGHALTLFKCYGHVPGRQPDFENDIYYVISGAKRDWDPYKGRLETATDDDCGIFKDDLSLKQALKTYNHTYGATAHMSLTFNVYMLICTMHKINCRVIDDSFNIFNDIHKNRPFIYIIVAELIMQPVLMHLSTHIFHLPVNGITWQQWLISAAWALSTFLVAVILKILPIDDFVDMAGHFGNKVWHVVCYLLGGLFCCRWSTAVKEQEKETKELSRKNKRSQLREAFKTKSILQHNNILNRKIMSKFNENKNKNKEGSKVSSMLRKNNLAYSVMPKETTFAGSKVIQKLPKQRKFTDNESVQDVKYFEKRNEQMLRGASENLSKILNDAKRIATEEHFDQLKRRLSQVDKLKNSFEVSKHNSISKDSSSQANHIIVEHEHSLIGDQ